MWEYGSPTISDAISDLVARNYGYKTQPCIFKLGRTDRELTIMYTTYAIPKQSFPPQYIFLLNESLKYIMLTTYSVLDFFKLSHRLVNLVSSLF